MGKTMAIFKGVVLVLVLVPLIGAMSVEDLERKNQKLELKNKELESELIKLKEIVSTLQAQMEMNTAQINKKVNVDDFADQMKIKADVTRIVLLEERMDAVESGVKLNDTEELEARVTVLEETVGFLEADVVDLADDMEDVEAENLLQDQRLNTQEAEIFDNENDIEELVDITNGLTIQVTSVEEDVTSLDQRVSDLETGGDGNGNTTDLEVRVETLEEVTSQLTDDVSSLEVNDVTQDERISNIEEDVTSLDQRVEDLESGGGGGGNVTGDYGDTAFLAALSSSNSSSANPVLFEREEINHGGHYNPETGKYTVPYDGIYQFSVHMTAYSFTSVLLFHINIDDSNLESHTDVFYHEHYRSTTVLLELQAGQTVSVYRGDGAYGCTNCLRSYFCGHMISAN